jgi:hypothetical protein
MRVTVGFFFGDIYISGSDGPDHITQYVLRVSQATCIRPQHPRYPAIEPRPTPQQLRCTNEIRTGHHQTSTLSHVSIHHYDHSSSPSILLRFCLTTTHSIIYAPEDGLPAIDFYDESAQRSSKLTVPFQWSYICYPDA